MSHNSFQAAYMQNEKFMVKVTLVRDTYQWISLNYIFGAIMNCD